MGEVEKKVLITIPFSNPEFAELAYIVLSVDKDLKGSGIQKELTVDGPILQIHFLAEDLKKLRVASNSYLKYVLLVVKTINKFNIT